MLKNEYIQCIEEMFKLRRFGIKLGLSRIKHLLNKLENPQNNFLTIHISGTNGKGSVASMLSTILQKSGYKTGLYTSPHLIKFNERIRINSKSISDKSVVNSWKILKSIQKSNEQLTFFEISTAMALYEFKRENVDIAVIETGMGGRFDATNILTPILSIITNISLEHKEYLGNTISKITQEKAGIIKSKIPVISAVSQKNAITIIDDIAKSMHSKVFLKGRDFRTRKGPGNTFSYISSINGKTRWHGMQTSLPGIHQIENASLALASCEILNKNNKIQISLNCIQSGLILNKWPGRLEVISTSPYILLDGAHNLNAIKKLIIFLKNNLKNKKIILIIGLLNDKPCESIIKQIAPQCSKIIVTQANNKRAVTTKILKKITEKFTKKVVEIKSVNKAIYSVLNNIKPNNALCITGSLYVIGEAIEVFRTIENHSNQI